MVRLKAPTPEDRAHDSEKGVAIYWKMPLCGFRLKLSPFVRGVLRDLDVAPAQIPAAAWCYISSFEEMFKQFRSELDKQVPTVPVFWTFFSHLWMNGCYAGIRKNPKSPCIFDTSGADKWNKFDDWNHAWVYLENPDDFDYWSGIRREWRHLSKPTQASKKSKKKKDALDMVLSLDPADQLRMGLVTSFVES